MNSVKSNGSSGPVTRRKSMDAEEKEVEVEDKTPAKAYTFKRIDTTKFDNKI